MVTTAHYQVLRSSWEGGCTRKQDIESFCPFKKHYGGCRMGSPRAVETAGTFSQLCLLLSSPAATWTKLRFLTPRTHSQASAPYTPTAARVKTWRFSPLTTKVSSVPQGDLRCPGLLLSAREQDKAAPRNSRGRDGECLQRPHNFSSVM